MVFLVTAHNALIAPIALLKDGYYCCLTKCACYTKGRDKFYSMLDTLYFMCTHLSCSNCQVSCPSVKMRKALSHVQPNIHKGSYCKVSNIQNEACLMVIFLSSHIFRMISLHCISLYKILKCRTHFN